MTLKRKILVTGGGGFLGGAIVRQLLDNGEQVCSYSRKTYAELNKLGVEQIQGDLADTDAVKQACDGATVVFHVAAKAGVWGTFNAYYRANVTGTRNILAACKSGGVKRLIYTSSPSVVFDGNDMVRVDESQPYPSKFHAHYPKTKALAEQAVLTAARDGLPAVALRPHLIWGPGDTHMAPRILARAHRLRQVGDGTNKVDTIYIDNAAHAHLLAEAQLKANPALSGKCYFISQDDPIPLWQMVNHILAAGGKPPVEKTISPAMARVAGSMCEAIYKCLPIQSEPPMTRFVARELSTAHWFNIAAAKRDLGYKPLVSMDEGLRRLKKWLKDLNRSNK